MAVSQGLFKSQDQAEQDLNAQPGWTIDEQKPEFWDGFGLLPMVEGVGAGAANGISVLAKGLQFHNPQTASEALAQGPAAFSTFQKEGPQELQPWQKKSNEVLADAETNARAGAKGLMPDPKTTGTAANLVNGFARSITEFGVGSLVGGPEVGAATLGTSEAYARYHDLRDQGVDESTARKSALITGLANAAGAITPFSLPAKLLEPLSAAGAFLTQTGAGAVINTSLGAVSRASDAAILRSAGYPEAADQAKPWDEANLLTDAVTGAFFGAHAGLQGLRDHPIGPAVRDAAKVVQDRAEVLNRAPGVPVDMPSAAIHREALETALGDLLSNKSVDLSKEETDGAEFARPDQDTELSREIIREEFTKAGVLDTAGDFDRWLRGEEGEPPIEHEPSIRSVLPAEAEEGAEPKAVPKQEPGEERPELELPGGIKAADALEKARLDSEQANREADKTFKTAADCELAHA